DDIGDLARCGEHRESRDHRRRDEHRQHAAQLVPEAHDLDAGRDEQHLHDVDEPVARILDMVELYHACAQADEHYRKTVDTGWYREREQAAQHLPGGGDEQYHAQLPHKSHFTSHLYIFIVRNQLYKILRRV